MPDGLMVNVPDAEAVPRPFARSAIISGSNRKRSASTLPCRKENNEANFQANGVKAGSNLRFLQEGAMVKDETTGPTSSR